MKEKIKQEYKNRITLNGNKLESFKKQSIRVAWLRGLIFLSGTVIGVYLLYQNWILSLISSILFLVPFIFFLIKSIKIKKQIAYYNQLVIINKQELDVLDWKYDKFKNGKEYLNYTKSYLYDLDIFGDGSLFQYLNRSATDSGEQLLASWFVNPEKNKEELESRQLAVVELMPLLDWRQDFLASGRLIKELHKQSEVINDWLHKDLFFSGIRFLPIIIKIVPLITLFVLIASIIGLIPLSIFAVYLILPLSIIGKHIKEINNEQRVVSHNIELLKKYAQLLKKIEEADFKSRRLGSYQYMLKNEEYSASGKVNELSKIIAGLDNRNNMLVGIVLDALLLWDLQYMLKLEKWRNENKDRFIKWIKLLSEFDAFSSLANFAYNNPNYVFPDIKATSFQLQTKECGHPLLHEKDRINNDISFDKDLRFLIITGANMAGKSTFLRALGVNLLLAMTGAPVCAGSFAFSPIELFTSMRTKDSLQKNESYFFAELSRLKELIDKLKAGEDLFIILDEVLKGTNSQDKKQGSKALLKQLIGLSSTGIIATHDVSLGQLEKEYPQSVKNKCFEVEIENNELIFDYKIKEGISKNLNATFLMKKMGITI